jgi:hypothetical protein
LEPSVFATYSIGCSVDDSKIRKATTPAFDWLVTKQFAEVFHMVVKVTEFL